MGQAVASQLRPGERERHRLGVRVGNDAAPVTGSAARWILISSRNACATLGLSDRYTQLVNNQQITQSLRVFNERLLPTGLPCWSLASLPT